MLNIHEHQIESWIQEGAKSAIQAALRDNYGAGANIKKAIDKAVSKAEPEITLAISQGISKACKSPGFMQAIEAELIKSLGNKFKGAFEAVIIAAARRAADDKIAADRLAGAVQAHVLGDTDTSTTSPTGA